MAVVNQISKNTIEIVEGNQSVKLEFSNEHSMYLVGRLITESPFSITHDFTTFYDDGGFPLFPNHHDTMEEAKVNEEQHGSIAGQVFEVYFEG